MKSVVRAVSVALAIGTPGVLLASQAANVVPAAPSPAPTPSAKYSLDTPIETIAADPAAKKVLDADLNNITAHPMYDQFKSMSLSQVQPLSQGVLSDAALAKVKTDLAAIK